MIISVKKRMYKECKLYLNGNGKLISKTLDRMRALIKIFVFGKIYLPYVELVVTTKCSLKCKDCGNLMQFYERPYDVQIDMVRESVENLLSAVDRVQIFRILGGEPFLYANLKEVLELLIPDRKIKVIGIPTNGTVLPKDKNIIKLLKNPKVRLDISDYKVRDISEFVDLCRNEGIHYSLAEDKVWEDRGKMESRKRTEKELDTQMEKCNQPCRSILNGKMFRCPRASHGDDLGIIKTPEDEFVNLLDVKSVSMLRKEIVNVYYRTKHVKACDYCNVGTDDLKTIAAGIQQ